MPNEVADVVIGKNDAATDHDVVVSPHQAQIVVSKTMKTAAENDNAIAVVAHANGAAEQAVGQGIDASQLIGDGNHSVFDGHVAEFVAGSEVVVDEVWDVIGVSRERHRHVVLEREQRAINVDNQLGDTAWISGGCLGRP